jgi:MinD-like ATPase involved in chromosome partitioning or flagellar assembly
MIETVRDCDYVVLVTEPTPFGLHDLRLAVEVARTLKLACGVVVNRACPVATETREWCAQAQVPILAEIPDSFAIAQAYAQGRLLVEAMPELQRIFDRLTARLIAEIGPKGRVEGVPNAVGETVRAWERRLQSAGTPVRRGTPPRAEARAPLQLMAAEPRPLPHD